VPKGLTSAQISALQREAARVKIAVEIGTSTPLRYCTGQEPVTISGAVYTPAVLTVSEVRVGALRSSEVRIAIADEDGSLSAAAYSGVSGAPATVYLLVESDDGTWSNPVELFSGRVAAVTLEDGVRLRLQVHGRVGLRWRVGLHEESRTCPLEFRGPLCQYSGADTTCERTWSDCASKGNTARFRGLRYAPEPGELIDLGPVVRVGGRDPGAVPVSQLEGVLDPRIRIGLHPDPVETISPWSDK